MNQGQQSGYGVRPYKTYYLVHASQVKLSESSLWDKILVKESFQQLNSLDRKQLDSDQT